MQTHLTGVAEKSTSNVSNKQKNKSFFAPVMVQPKLSISPVDDAYEHEADATAEKVTRMPNPEAASSNQTLPVIQKKCAACEEEEKLQLMEAGEEAGQSDPIADIPIQRKCAACEEEDQQQLQLKPKTAGYSIIQMKCSSCESDETNQEPGASLQLKPIVETSIQRTDSAYAEEGKINLKENNQGGTPVVSPLVTQVLASSGQPIDESVRNFMEPWFGYDFSSVQIHNNSLAHQSSSTINALAYTHKNHIVFGNGRYQPQTVEGKKLLAHELTHVIQQNAGISAKKILRARARQVECAHGPFTSSSGAVITDPVSFITETETRAIEMIDAAIASLIHTRTLIAAGEEPFWPTIVDALGRALT
ncbi:hypothetical protein C3K47_05835, partial [Solitalea longa]